MCGMAAMVTSCIGGKDEKFAVQVRLVAPASVYFVYKTMDEFEALWGSLETLTRHVATNHHHEKTITKSEEGDDRAPSSLAKWLARVVDH